jgi:hypothetical protein
MFWVVSALRPRWLVRLRYWWGHWRHGRKKLAHAALYLTFIAPEHEPDEEAVQIIFERMCL